MLCTMRGRQIAVKVTSAIAAFIALASFIVILAGESWQREVLLLVTSVAPLPLWAIAAGVTTLRGDPIMEGDDDTKALRIPHACFFLCCCANGFLWFDAASKGPHENWAAVFLIVVAVFYSGLLLVLGLILRLPTRTRRLSRQLFIGLGFYVGSWAATIGAVAALG
jgi:hypothetical protein